MSIQRSKWVKPVILAAALVTAGGVGIAAAKSGGWGDGGCMRHGGQGHMSGMFEPGRHVEGRLAFLKTELKITPEQEAAWEEFADVVRRNAEARAERWQARSERRKEMSEGDSTRSEAPALDERIDRGIELMEQRLAAFKEMGDAAKVLYGELNADQQALADRMLSRRHGRRSMF